jgi:hypothetical protein
MIDGLHVQNGAQREEIVQVLAERWKLLLELPAERFVIGVGGWDL